MSDASITGGSTSFGSVPAGQNSYYDKVFGGGGSAPKVEQPWSYEVGQQSADQLYEQSAARLRAGGVDPNTFDDRPAEPWWSFGLKTLAGLGVAVDWLTGAAAVRTIIGGGMVADDEIDKYAKGQGLHAPSGKELLLKWGWASQADDREGQIDVVDALGFGLEMGLDPGMWFSLGSSVAAEAALKGGSGALREGAELLIRETGEELGKQLSRDAVIEVAQEGAEKATTKVGSLLDIITRQLPKEMDATAYRLAVVEKMNAVKQLDTAGLLEGLDIAGKVRKDLQTASMGLLPSAEELLAMGGVQATDPLYKKLLKNTTREANAAFSANDAFRDLRSFTMERILNDPGGIKFGPQFIPGWSLKQQGAVSVLSQKQINDLMAKAGLDGAKLVDMWHNSMPGRAIMRTFVSDYKLASLKSVDAPLANELIALKRMAGYKAANELHEGVNALVSVLKGFNKTTDRVDFLHLIEAPGDIVKEVQRIVSDSALVRIKKFAEAFPEEGRVVLKSLSETDRGIFAKVDSVLVDHPEWQEDIYGAIAAVVNGDAGEPMRAMSDIVDEMDGIARTFEDAAVKEHLGAGATKKYITDELGAKVLGPDGKPLVNPAYAEYQTYKKSGALPKTMAEKVAGQHTADAMFSAGKPLFTPEHKGTLIAHLEDLQAGMGEAQWSDMTTKVLGESDPSTIVERGLLTPQRYDALRESWRTMHPDMTMSQLPGGFDPNVVGAGHWMALTSGDERTIRYYELTGEVLKRRAAVDAQRMGDNLQFAGITKSRLAQAGRRVAESRAALNPWEKSQLVMDALMTVIQERRGYQVIADKLGSIAGEASEVAATQYVDAAVTAQRIMNDVSKGRDKMTAAVYDLMDALHAPVDESVESMSDVMGQTLDIYKFAIDNNVPVTGMARTKNNVTMTIMSAQDVLDAGGDEALLGYVAARNKAIDTAEWLMHPEDVAARRLRIDENPQDSLDFLDAVVHMGDSAHKSPVYLYVDDPEALIDMPLLTAEAQPELGGLPAIRTFTEPTKVPIPDGGNPRGVVRAAIKVQNPYYIDINNLPKKATAYIKGTKDRLIDLADKGYDAIYVIGERGGTMVKDDVKRLGKMGDRIYLLPSGEDMASLLTNDLMAKKATSPGMARPMGLTAATALDSQRPIIVSYRDAGGASRALNITGDEAAALRKGLKNFDGKAMQQRVVNYLTTRGITLADGVKPTIRNLDGYVNSLRIINFDPASLPDFRAAVQSLDEVVSRDPALIQNARFLVGGGLLGDVPDPNSSYVYHITGKYREIMEGGLKNRRQLARQSIEEYVKMTGEAEPPFPAWFDADYGMANLLLNRDAPQAAQNMVVAEAQKRVLDMVPGAREIDLGDGTKGFPDVWRSFTDPDLGMGRGGLKPEGVDVTDIPMEAQSIYWKMDDLYPEVLAKVEAELAPWMEFADKVEIAGKKGFGSDLWNWTHISSTVDAQFAERAAKLAKGMVDLYGGDRTLTEVIDDISESVTLRTPKEVIAPEQLMEFDPIKKAVAQVEAKGVYMTQAVAGMQLHFDEVLKRLDIDSDEYDAALDMVLRSLGYSYEDVSDIVQRLSDVRFDIADVPLAIMEGKPLEDAQKAAMRAMPKVEEMYAELDNLWFAVKEQLPEEFDMGEIVASSMHGGSVGTPSFIGIVPETLADAQNTGVVRVAISKEAAAASLDVVDPKNPMSQGLWEGVLDERMAPRGKTGFFDGVPAAQRRNYPIVYWPGMSELKLGEGAFDIIPEPVVLGRMDAAKFYDEARLFLKTEGDAQRIYLPKPEELDGMVLLADEAKRTGAAMRLTNDGADYFIETAFNNGPLRGNGAHTIMQAVKYAKEQGKGVVARVSTEAVEMGEAFMAMGFRPVKNTVRQSDHTVLMALDDVAWGSFLKANPKALTEGNIYKYVLTDGTEVMPRYTRSFIDLNSPDVSDEVRRFAAATVEEEQARVAADLELYKQLRAGQFDEMPKDWAQAADLPAWDEVQPLQDAIRRLYQGDDVTDVIKTLTPEEAATATLWADTARDMYRQVNATGEARYKSWGGMLDEATSTEMYEKLVDDNYDAVLKARAAGADFVNDPETASMLAYLWTFRPKGMSDDEARVTTQLTALCNAYRQKGLEYGLTDADLDDIFRLTRGEQTVTVGGKVVPIGPGISEEAVEALNKKVSTPGAWVAMATAAGFDVDVDADAFGKFIDKLGAASEEFQSHLDELGALKTVAERRTAGEAILGRALGIDPAKWAELDILEWLLPTPNYMPHVKTGDDTVGYFRRLIGAYTPEAEKVRNRAGGVFPLSDKMPNIDHARQIQGTVEHINRLFGEDFFYADPAKAMSIYIQRMTKAINSRDFLQSLYTMTDSLGERVVRLAPLIEETGEYAVKPGYALFELPAMKFLSSDFDRLAADFPEMAVTIAKAKKDGKALKFMAQKEIVQEVERSAKAFLSDEQMTNYLKLYDKMLGIWKGYVTVVRPGFHVRNWMTNVWQNMMAGVVNPKWYDQALRIQRDGAVIEKYVVDELSNGRVKSYVQAYQDLVAAGRLEAKSYKLGNSDFTTGVIYQMSKEQGIIGSGRVGSDIHVFTDQQLARLNPIRGRMNPMSQAFIPTTAGRFIGESIENNARVAHFIALYDATNDASAAAWSVRKYLFDYNELTDIERNVFRRIVPFYSWIRKNIALQTEMMVKRPFFPATAIRLTNRVDQTAQQTYAPKWATEMGAFALPGVTLGMVNGMFNKATGGVFNLDETVESPLMLNIGLPYLDFLNMNVKDQFSAVSPIIKVPLETLMNYQTYLEKPIQEYDGQLVTAPRSLNSIDAVIRNGANEEQKASWNAMLTAWGVYYDENEKKLKTGAWFTYAYKALAPAIEAYGKMVPSDDPAAATDMANFLTGIKFIPIDQPTQGYYYKRDKAQVLLDAIKAAEDKGITIPNWSETPEYEQQKAAKRAAGGWLK